MTQKILKTLQKISPDVRSIGGALLLTLAVHLLLLLLFGHTAGESQQDTSELPKVGCIVLSDKSNAEFSEWMKNHDPSVMTSADQVWGYSYVIAGNSLRNEVEDLPNILQPVIPQKAAVLDRISGLKSNSRLLLPPTGVMTLPGRKEAAAAAVNGKYSSELSSILKEKFSEVPEKTVSGLRANENTVLELAPGRLKGTGARIVVSQGSGSDFLDNKAVETLRRYLLETAGRVEISGTVIFEWQKFLPLVLKQKEQK